MDAGHSTRNFTVAALLSCAVLPAIGCTTWSGWPNGFRPSNSVAAPPNGPRSEWWDANKHRAVFVPGKGNQIEGLATYFDDRGRPIGKSVEQASFALHGAQDPAEEEPAESPGISKRVVSSARNLVGQGPDEQRARVLFAEAETLFRKKEYQSAASRYKKAARRWPDSALEHDALFMHAECLFFADRYAKANDAYEAHLKKYPGSRRLDDIVRRQFDIAWYWQQLDDADPRLPVTPNLNDKTRPRFDALGHAIRTYENIRINDPTGPLADDALMATARAYFQRGRYDDADYHYGLVRREYPKSEHQFEAHLMELKAKLNKYQGADYGGAPLDEADQLIEQLLTQFRDRLGDDREKILQMRGQVAARRALRDWTLAEYYAKGQHYGAARFYYDRIVRSYPETNFAQQAAKRLEDFRDQPASPPQRFDWIANLFPEAGEQPILAQADSDTESRR